eukprot:jgi/Mesvir1/16864/Mv15750-RA.1
MEVHISQLLVSLAALFVTSAFSVTASGDHTFHFPSPNNCSDDTFCNGIERLLTTGSCARSTLAICDDRNPDTVDTCTEEALTCGHTPRANTSICLETCTPVCVNKECGEDGCGGFCGSCPQGKGCQCSSQDADGNCIASSCVNVNADGTCQSPLAFGSARAASTYQLAGSYGSPQCNVASAAPELFYTFTIPPGRKYGVDMRATGYDTVLQLLTGCSSANLVACSDDATPPGNLGSRVSALLTTGTYYVMIDGYSALDSGPFTINARFVDNCVPLCDGNYCGDDGCGYKCGTCDSGKVCRSLSCYQGACEPKCASAWRFCGEDGCGGSCGTCTGATQKCVGEGFELDENGNPPPSFCAAFPTCNHTHPVCTGCSATQYCGHDCQCYDLNAQVPDLVLDHRDLEMELVLETVTFVNSSCALRGGCVYGSGPRKLLRFTTSALNQGGTWRPIGSTAEAKERPDVFKWAPCRGEYELLSFSAATLRTPDAQLVVASHINNVVCLEDSSRVQNGSTVGCRGTYTCENRGLSQGWLDRFGWSLDCSWLDVTDVPPGNYLLELVLNPNQIFHESNFDNNAGSVPVHIPCKFPLGPIAASRTGTEACSSATGVMANVISSALLASVVAVGLAALLQCVL